MSASKPKSRQALSRLTVVNLRGAVGAFSFEFAKGKPLTIVYGENGSGKSTICDALDLIGSGTVGSLKDRGLGSGTKNYWPSLGKSTADIRVSFEAADGVCNARIHKNDVVTDGAARPRVMVLRRAQILSVVTVPDGDRYKVIQPFIDVTAIETCEAKLLAAAKSVNVSLDTAATRIQEQRDAIRGFWNTVGSPGSDAFSWAKGEVSRSAEASAAEVALLEKARQAFLRLADAVSARSTAVLASAKAIEDVATARDDLHVAIGTISGGAADLVLLLEAAQAHFASHNAVGVCPLCESADRADGLAARVTSRLAALKSVQEAGTVLSSRERLADVASQQLASAEISLTAQQKALDTACASALWPTGVARPVAAAQSSGAAQQAWVVANAHLVEEWRRASATRESTNTFAKALARAWKTYTDNLAEQVELARLLPRLQLAHDIVKDERKRFTDEVLSSIADEVGRLYEKVHPEEGVGKISLGLDPDKRSSLKMGTSFGGQKDLPPAAYLSESHLDTLGLCLFLALASRESPRDTVLVLDDPLASVDAPHADRTIEMLYDEVEKFRHCVITTHFKPWREKYRWGKLRNGDCQFVELTRWSATAGLSVTGTVPELERLRSVLATTEPDVQSVCAKAGVVLEAALDFLTTKYRCAVPRNEEGRYTLDELLSAVNGKLRKSLRVERLDTADDGSSFYSVHELGPHLDALTDIAKVRNIVGCHFNELSFEALDEDAFEFGRQVVILMDLLTDEGSWPKSAKSGSYWETVGGTRRLHPLQKPA